MEALCKDKEELVRQVDEGWGGRGPKQKEPLSKDLGQRNHKEVEGA